LLSLGKAKNVFFPSFAGRIKKLHPQAEKEDGRRRLHRPRFNVSFIARLLYYDIIAERPGPILQPQGATRASRCIMQNARQTECVESRLLETATPVAVFFSPDAFRVCGRKHKHIHAPHIPCGYGRVCTRDDNNTLSFSLAPSSYSHMERFWLFPLFGVVMLLRALPAHKYA
jgi:hypothetical protein